MKAHWVKFVVVVMVVLLIGGCAKPFSQIRQSEPDLTFNSINPPKEVAKCIDQRTRTEMRGSTWKANPSVAFEQYANQTYHIVLIEPPYTVPPYTGLADILVKPSGSGSVVEYRRARWWAGEKEFFEIIDQCGRQAEVK